MKCARSERDLMLSIFEQWEKETGFQTEETEYSALYSRDINNYIAIKPDGSFKTKGEYAETSLSKTPATHICSRALVDYLQLGIPIEKTILACTDIRDFVSVRGVTGGGVKDGEFLGKAVRWYYAKNQTGCIVYHKNGNKVPKTDGAKPLMTLPENLPGDIDYDWYVAETKSMLKDLGL
jgi:hypothetical protein